MSAPAALQDVQQQLDCVFMNNDGAWQSMPCGACLAARGGGAWRQSLTTAGLCLARRQQPGPVAIHLGPIRQMHGHGCCNVLLSGGAAVHQVQRQCGHGHARCSVAHQILPGAAPAAWPLHCIAAFQHRLAAACELQVALSSAGIQAGGTVDRDEVLAALTRAWGKRAWAACNTK